MEKLLLKTEKKYMEVKNIKEKISQVLLFIFCIFVQTNMVFASSGADFGKNLLTTILNSLISVIFIGLGALLLIFGVVETIISVTGQNPDAKNKAIIGWGAGILMIVLGVIFLGLIPDIVGFMFA